MKQFNNLTIPVVFFGSSSHVIPIIEVLRKNFNLILVVTTEKNPTDAVPAYCLKNKIPYLSIQQFNNLATRQLKKVNALVGVLADFGLIIPEKILNAFPKGILNIHPSLLPKYRGSTPVQTAILNGEKETGVSIIKLDEKIDHGPILAQVKEKILPMDTAKTLYKRLFSLETNLLPKILNSYLKDKLKPIAQDHSKATFTKTLIRLDGFLDLSLLQSENCKVKIARMIRAYYPWPGVWTKLKVQNEKLKIIKLLPFGKLQVEGKKPMSYQDFLNGYPQAKEIIKMLF